jgi:hypothetical protein
MQKTTENIKNCNYSSLSADLKYISAYKEMIESVFGEDISFEYSQIINQSTESFRFRYTIKFNQIIENLTIDQIENISYDYRNISFHLDYDK